MNNGLIILAGLTLLAAPAAPAAPPAPAPVTIPAAHSAAATAVQQYLTARNAGQYDKAYALLSTASRKMLPFGQFEAVKHFPSDPSADGMTPLLTCLSAFFVDTHNTLGYQYFVIGALLDTPYTVLVRAHAPGVSSVFLLKVVAAPDSVDDQPRLDLMQSMTKTDTQGMLKADQWAQTAVLKSKMRQSESNLKEIGLGIILYLQGHDETYPDADKWMDEIRPYVENETIFHDPSDPAGKKWGYAFNRNLSGVKLAQVDTPSATVLVFESTTGTKNASDTGTSIPRPGRYLGGTAYLFNDGDVKWLPDGARLSFLLSGK